TAVITSPAVIPAAAAPVPQSTPSTRAPERAGATDAGTPAAASESRQLGGDSACRCVSAPGRGPCSPRACSRGIVVVVDGAITPRKPATPKVLPGAGWPAAICRATAIAPSMGIA